MATIVVEDGSIVAGANSLNTALELTSYAEDRGVTLTGDPTILLIQANDAMWALPFKGELVDVDQGTPFPRNYLTVNGFEINNDEIPLLAKKLQLEYAIAIDQGTYTSTVQRQIKRAQDASGASVEYADGASPVVINRNILSVAKPLLNNDGMLGHFFVRPSCYRGYW